MRSFVLGLAGIWPLSVILAWIALGRIRDTGQSGRTLAILGLVASAVWAPIEIIAIIHS